MTVPPFYLGIDFGTSGVRAIAIDGEGAVVAEARVALPPPLRNNGGSEQAPQLWWQGLEATLDRLRERISFQEIAALAVDGTSGTLLLADQNGKPLTPALMYNDGRSQREAMLIETIAPRESAAHGATSALAKLLYLKPGRQARHALHQADWIVGRLTGQFGISDENNCLKLGYDPITKQWPQWLDRLGVRRQLLPRVVTPASVIGPVSPSIQQRFGLNPSCQVVAGTTDSTAAFIATGAQKVGEAVTSLGSTLVLKVISQRPVFSPEHGVYAQPLGQHWLVGGGSNSGGAVLLHYFSKEEMERMTPLLRPDQATGYDYYPLLSRGERFPLNDPHLAPRLTPRPADDKVFFQGMLEGMARIEHEGYRRLEALGAPYPTSVRCAGGGCHNPAWSRIRQRLLKTPFVAAHHQEAAYGSALLARKGCIGL